MCFTDNFVVKLIVTVAQISLYNIINIFNKRKCLFYLVIHATCTQYVLLAEERTPIIFQLTTGDPTLYILQAEERNPTIFQLTTGDADYMASSYMCPLSVVNTRRLGLTGINPSSKYLENKVTINH